MPRKQITLLPSINPLPTDEAAAGLFAKILLKHLDQSKLNARAQKASQETNPGEATRESPTREKAQAGPSRAG